MSGDRAQGFLGDVKSCSNVGSIYLGRVGWAQQIVSARVQIAHFQAACTHSMNRNAALEPHGRVSGRSNMFPNKTSSAACG
jgi:hypothetical protein